MFVVERRAVVLGKHSSEGGRLDWDVFISHAHEDKGSVARPLAEALMNVGMRVWLDDHELVLGDSLRRKIDEGLISSKFGVVVLSRAFFSKTWPQLELDALATRQSAERRMLLPVWHGIDGDFIRQHSLILAGIVGTDTRHGIPSVARDVIRAISYPPRDEVHTPESAQRGPLRVLASVRVWALVVIATAAMALFSSRLSWVETLVGRRGAPPHAPVVPESELLSVRLLPGLKHLRADSTWYAFRMGFNEQAERVRNTTLEKVRDDPRVQDLCHELSRLRGLHSRGTPLYSFLYEALQSDAYLTATDLETSPGPVAEKERVYFGAILPTSATLGSLETTSAALLGSIPIADPTTAIPGPCDGRFIEDERASHGIITWCGENAYWASDLSSLHWGLSANTVGALADDRGFLETQAPVFAGMSGKPLTFIYHDFSRGWRSSSGVEPDGGWNMLSWRSVDAMACATFVEGAFLRSRYFLRIGSVRTGLFRHTLRNPVDQKWLAMVPEDCDGFVTGLWDFRSFIVTAELAFGLLSGWGDASALPTVDYLEWPTKLIAAIGSKYLLYFPRRDPSETVVFPVPRFVMTAELSNPDAVRSFIREGLVADGRADGMQKFEGVDTVTIPFLDILELRLAVSDDVLIVASDGASLKDALRRRKVATPSVVDSPAYRSTMGRIQKDAHFLLYFRPGGFINSVYNVFIPFMKSYFPLVRRVGLVGSADSGFDWSLVPSGSDLAQYVLEPTILSGFDDGRGVLFEGYSPLLRGPALLWYLYALSAVSSGGEGIASSVGQLMEWMLDPEEPLEAHTQGCIKCREAAGASVQHQPVAPSNTAKRTIGG